MFYESELRFLCDVFQKNHVNAIVEDYDKLMELGRGGDISLNVIGTTIDVSSLCDALPTSKPYTLYNLTDGHLRCFSYLLLPGTDVSSVLYIGPYLSMPVKPQEILEIGERYGIAPKQQKYLHEYYQGLEVISKESPLFVMLHTFCERIWRRPHFSIVDINSPTSVADVPMDRSLQNNEFDDILLNMKAMEQRYAFENEMIRAVTLGQIHMENRLFAAFSGEAFEKRLADPLRNAKNYGVIMNTLLRKAAEEGGVHPVYIDRVSSDFAARIEQMTSTSQNTELMCDMFRTYCRLVRKHSIQKYSAAVQKAILLISSDLSAELSPNALAKAQGISLGYLSTIFKKETGLTLSEYIREKRICHAEHLLVTTNLQVQTVALHCGMLDVQYFSKIFKKQTGKSPKEYRESMRRSE